MRKTIYGSIAGEMNFPEAAGYCASKAATNAFVKQLIVEQAHTDLRILLVNPPPVDTPLLNPEKTGRKAFSTRQKDLMLKRGFMVQPDFILDEIEKGLEKKKSVIFPGYFAKMVVNLYKFAPSRMNHLMAKSTA